jgi:hypothetical protein
MNGKELYFVNGYGIKVKKCCASCSHMQPDHKTRICLNGEGTVSPKSYCLDWELRKGLDNAGKGNGSVKTDGYLQHCLGILEEDNAKAIECAQKKVAFRRRTLENIRTAYREKHGDIYAL